MVDSHLGVRAKIFTLVLGRWTPALLAGIGARLCAGRWLRLRATMEPGTTSTTGEIDLIMGDRTL